MSKMTGSDRGITRRDFLKLGSTAALSLACGGLTRTAFAAAGRNTPNILLIITDQQHIDTIAAAGCSHAQTPGLDALAERGTRFVHSHSANPLCSPARSAILSGRTSSETGVHHNNLGIRPDIPNIGQWLSQETDYETVYAGKWHLPRGHTHFMPGFTCLSTGIGGQGNLGDTATSRACEGYLRNRSRSQPFMMVASFMQPHDICEWLRLNSRRTDALPYPELAGQLPELPDNFDFDPREPEAVRTRREGNEGLKNGWTEQQWRYYLWSYYRHVEMVDAEIGRVLQALDDNGYTDNTLLIFTADHGEGTAHHQMTRKNSLYDEALKVPLLLSLPGHVPENHADQTHLVSGLDIVPTVCDCVGVGMPNSMRGRSLRTLLEAQSGARRSFCVSEVLNNTGRMVRTDGFKYVTYKDDPVEQLFDVKNDPGETRNLAFESSHASTLEEHRELLREWEKHLDIAENVPGPATWGQG